MNPTSIRALTLLFVLITAIVMDGSRIVSAGTSSVHLDLAAMVLRPSEFGTFGIKQECHVARPGTRSITTTSGSGPLGPTGGVIPDHRALAASGANRIQFTHHAAQHRTDDACGQLQFQGVAILEYQNEATATAGMDAMYNVWIDSTKLVEAKVTRQIGDDAFYMVGSFRGSNRETDDTRAMLVFRSRNIISVIVITSISPATMPSQRDVEELALLQLGRIGSVLNGDLRVAGAIAPHQRQSHANPSHSDESVSHGR